MPPTWADTEDRSINYKETLTAIEGLERTADRCEPGTLIRLAIDNSTAVSVLTRKSIGWDAALDERLERITKRLSGMECAFVAIYTPGHMQPADEPSRLRPVDESKVTAALKWLRDRDDGWWDKQAASGSDAIRVNTKRDREPEPGILYSR